MPSEQIQGLSRQSQGKAERPDILKKQGNSIFLLLLLAAQSPEPAKADQQQKHPKATAEKPALSKGFYGTLGLGTNWLQKVSGHGPVTSFVGVDYKINTTAQFNTGFSGEVGLGYDFGDIRTELTYIHNNQSLRDVNSRLIQETVTPELNNKINSSRTSQDSVFISLYYDFPCESKAKPYIGGGIGYTNVHWAAFDSSGFDYALEQSNGSGSVLGYQAKLGISYNLSKQFDLFAEGIYQGSGQFKIGKLTRRSPIQTQAKYDQLNNLGLRIGTRFRF